MKIVPLILQTVIVIAQVSVGEDGDVAKKLDCAVHHFHILTDVFEIFARFYCYI